MKSGALTPGDAVKDEGYSHITIEIHKGCRIGVMAYTHEATTTGTGKNGNQYFYGHSDAEVLAKILAHILEMQ